MILYDRNRWRGGFSFHYDTASFHIPQIRRIFKSPTDSQAKPTGQGIDNNHNQYLWYLSVHTVAVRAAL